MLKRQPTNSQSNGRTTTRHSLHDNNGMHRMNSGDAHLPAGDMHRTDELGVVHRIDEGHPRRPELGDLIQLFFPKVDELGQFREVTAEQMPEPYQHLLAHDRHMTVTVEEFHGSLVDVVVLNSQREDQHYCRKILLRKQSDGQTVQFGIVRLDLNALQSQVQAEILAGRTPLGRVLINHHVLREVQLSCLWQVKCEEELAKYFGIAPSSVTFGRTALIYCDGKLAIELLEIVAPV